MRCFVAIELSKEVKAKLSEIQEKLPGANLKKVAVQNMHITLKFLGEIEDKKAWDAERRLEQFTVSPFKVKIEKIGAFPNERYPKVIWAGCVSKELGELAEKVDMSLSNMNFESEPFRPHITIARVKGDVELGEFFDSARDSKIGEIEVKSFELKKSVLGKDGPAYATIRKFMQKA